jgi:tRNA A37 threonylcarbamoyladenosine dehydratase
MTVTNTSQAHPLGNIARVGVGAAQELAVDVHAFVTAEVEREIVAARAEIARLKAAVDRVREAQRDYALLCEVAEAAEAFVFAPFNNYAENNRLVDAVDALRKARG